MASGGGLVVRILCSNMLCLVKPAVLSTREPLRLSRGGKPSKVRYSSWLQSKGLEEVGVTSHDFDMMDDGR